MFFSIVKDVSEATELLSPLKATCALIIRALDTTRVRIPILFVQMFYDLLQTINKSKDDWADLIKKLEQQRDNLQVFIKNLEGKDSSGDLSPIKPLASYAQYVASRIGGHQLTSMTEWYTTYGYSYKRSIKSRKVECSRQ
jgi:hypothetical protein